MLLAVGVEVGVGETIVSVDEVCVDVGSIGALEGKSGVDDTADGEATAQYSEDVDVEEPAVDVSMELESVDSEAPVRT